MGRNEFVTKLGELLHEAKRNLVSCRLATGDKIVEEHKGDKFWSKIYSYIFPSEHEEWVVVTCENDYQYFINVSGNSLAAIAEAVFDAMVSK